MLRKEIFERKTSCHAMISSYLCAEAHLKSKKGESLLMVFGIILIVKYTWNGKHICSNPRFYPVLRSWADSSL